MLHLVILLYAGFASTFTISKTALEFTQPLFLLGGRMMIAGTALLIYVYFFDRSQFKISRPMWRGMALVGIFNVFLANAFELWGLQDLSSAKTCFIYSLSPFFSAILSYFYFTEVMTPKKWLGMLIALSGFVPVFAGHTEAETLVAGQGIFSWAELYVIIAAISTVYGWILLKQLMAVHQCSFLLVNGFAMLIGGSMALALSWSVEPWEPLPLPLTHLARFFGWVLLLILISNFICYNLYGYLLKTFSATFLSFAGLITPFFASLFGWYFLEEIHSMSFLFSIFVVSLGLFVFYAEELRQGYLKPPG